MQATNPFTRDFQEAARLEAEAARARGQNVGIFTRMFMSLGPDVLKLDGTRHDAEMMEASGHAASRWARLLDLEAQLQRDDAVLASRPKKGPAAPATTFYPTARSKRDRAWEQETQVRREGLTALRDQAKVERKELECFHKR